MSKAEMWWYFIGLGLAAGGGSAIISASLKTDSLFSFAIFGFVVGILWGPFWKVTFSKLFEKEEGGEDNK